MCSTPDIPNPPPPPPPPQAAKAPAINSVRKKNPLAPLAGMSAGTVGPGLLTGSQGIAQSSLNVGTNQLLGGGS